MSKRKKQELSMKKKYYIFLIIGILLAFSIIFCIHIKKQKNLDKITYLQLLPDSMDLFDEGEVLWRFERDGSDINTVWLEGRVLHPYLSDMDGEIIRRSFEKVADESLSEEAEISDVWGERERSGVPAEKGDQLEDTEDDVAAVREMVKAIDFNVEQPHMELTEEEDRAYREAFLRLLKNELRIEGYPGGNYYEDLWKSISYDELLEWRDRDFPAYYYDDIDGDGKPEFGVNCGCVYFFDYELGEEICSLYYSGQSVYFGKLLGVGKIWEFDGQHAWIERDRYIVMNSDGEWEPVLNFELCFDENEKEGIYTKSYRINGVHVEREIWEELTAPFYEAIEYEVPKKTMVEVFGELLETE